MVHGYIIKQSLQYNRETSPTTRGKKKKFEWYSASSWCFYFGARCINIITARLAELIHCSAIIYKNQFTFSSTGKTIRRSWSVKINSPQSGTYTVVPRVKLRSAGSVEVWSAVCVVYSLGLFCLCSCDIAPRGVSDSTPTQFPVQSYSTQCSPQPSPAPLTFHHSSDCVVSEIKCLR